MPIIIDANRAGDFSSPLSGHAGEILCGINSGNLTVAIGGLLAVELTKTKLGKLLMEWSRAGRICRVATVDVTREIKLLPQNGLLSNDAHVIALARACGARLVYTDDKNLILDFKNVAFISPKGKVIQTTTAADVARRLLLVFGR